MVQDSKGRVRPTPRTLAQFMPPGLASITEDGPMSRAELEKGLDLIQGLLDDKLTDHEKREQAGALAAAASVPWCPPAPPAAVAPRPRRHLNRRSRFAQWCDCNDSNCSPEGNMGF